MLAALCGELFRADIYNVPAGVLYLFLCEKSLFAIFVAAAGRALDCEFSYWFIASRYLFLSRAVL